MLDAGCSMLDVECYMLNVGFPMLYVNPAPSNPAPSNPAPSIEHPAPSIEHPAWSNPAPSIEHPASSIYSIPVLFYIFRDMISQGHPCDLDVRVKSTLFLFASNSFQINSRFRIQ